MNWTVNFLSCPVKNLLGFSYFEFKIRLIRLGLSFQRQQIPVLELTTYCFSVMNHNHCIKKPIVRFLTCVTHCVQWAHVLMPFESLIITDTAKVHSKFSMGTSSIILIFFSPNSLKLVFTNQACGVCARFTFLYYQTVAFIYP